jgi:site-specific DNA-methyltransferase (adenine-specific)
MSIAFDVQTSFAVRPLSGTDSMARAPGSIRDAIMAYLAERETGASVSEIREGIEKQLGKVPASSVRSYLNLNVPEKFERTSRGSYRLKKKLNGDRHHLFIPAKRLLVNADCFEWLEQREPYSIHAVVTDPPYGLVEYTEKEQAKLRNGKGGVWRIPPSFDGHKRAPLPRFTVLQTKDHQELHRFFKRLAILLSRVVVPGGNVVVASNPLVSHIVASAMSEGGLELRGYIARLTMTMRGGDRPKNAHVEFADVSVMPRSMWEPWVVLRRPLDGRVQDNLRRWGTGGFRRLSAKQPFGDVIRSRPTPKAERNIAPHPSLKPQEFLRALVRAALPTGRGVVLDPFAGSGSTLAAADALGYMSIGVEKDATYFMMAHKAIPALARLSVNQAPSLAANGTRGGNGKAAKKSDRTAYQEGGRLRREGGGRAGRFVLRASKYI